MSSVRTATRACAGRLVNLTMGPMAAVEATTATIADLFTKARAQRSCAYARRGRELPKWLGLNPNATFDLPDGRQCRGVLMPSICELPQGSAPGGSGGY